MKKFVVLFACFVLAGIAAGQDWENGPQSPFAYCRFDGEYFPGTAKVYFLGGRFGTSTTLGDIYSYTPSTDSYADVGVDMPLAVSNYDVCLLRDDHARRTTSIRCRSTTRPATRPRCCTPMLSRAVSATRSPWPPRPSSTTT